MSDVVVLVVLELQQQPLQEVSGPLEAAARSAAAEIPEMIQEGTPQTLSALVRCRMSQQDTGCIASAK